jgi:hypothetical protein
MLLVHITHPSDARGRSLRDETTRLPSGERLHVAVLPTETFF